MMNNGIPTDSVLRRHYEAAHAKPSEEAPGQSENAPARQATDGFFAWLKRVFGG